jgi:methionine sulfoxide reductase heme-binding subunit
VSGPVDPAQHYWWLASRASGLIALALVTASVALGLTMAGRLRRGPAARVAHEHLALAALVAVAVHGLTLLGDSWLRPGLAGIAVPFELGYRPVFTGLGVLAGYLTAALALSYYVRRRIGGRTWRKLHRLTIVAYALALVHALGAGTDAGLPAVRMALLASAAPIVVLALYRVASAPASARGRGSAAPSPRPTAAPQDAGA